ncbi:MAG: hypothetical protein R3F56_22755 [Planctomycetota bacterium]
MRPLRFLVGAAALLVAGCFEADTTITLHADGSGTQKMRLALGDAALRSLRNAAQVAEASASRVDPLDVYDEKKVRAELSETGVELVSHRVSESERQRCVELAVKFPDLAALRRNPLAGGSRATWQLSGGARPEQVRLVYYPQGIDAWRAARDKARELAREPDEIVRHFVESRLRAVDGLDVALTLELPGDVVAHTANLQLTGPRTVRVQTRASDISSATALLVRLAPRFEVVFECPTFVFPPAAPAAEQPAVKDGR